MNWMKFIFNPSDLLHHVREKWLDMMLYIVVLTNTLWFTKNKVVHENLVPDVEDMKKFVSRYMKSTVRHGLTRDAPLDDLLHSDHLKINFDVALKDGILSYVVVC